MKLAISNIAWEKEQDNTLYKMMKDYGYMGLEIAPTRIFPFPPYQDLSVVKSWFEEFKQIFGFEIVSMQSIWYGRNENVFNSESDRSILIDYTKKAILFASTLQCKNLVFGCPKNRIKPDNQTGNEVICFFKELGEYALKNNTTIGMEANPTIYNTNYINYTNQAVELIEKVNSEGFKLNLDLGTILYNNEDISWLKCCGNKINHVHISEPYLAAVEQRDIHYELSSMLKDVDYNGYVSIEMSRQADLKVLEKTMKYISKVFG